MILINNMRISLIEIRQIAKIQIDKICEVIYDVVSVTTFICEITAVPNHKCFQIPYTVKYVSS